MVRTETVQDAVTVEPQLDTLVGRKPECYQNTYCSILASCGRENTFAAVSLRAVMSQGCHLHAVEGFWTTINWYSCSLSKSGAIMISCFLDRIRISCRSSSGSFLLTCLTALLAFTVKWETSDAYCTDTLFSKVLLIGMPSALTMMTPSMPLCELILFKVSSTMVMSPILRSAAKPARVICAKDFETLCLTFVECWRFGKRYRLCPSWAVRRILLLCHHGSSHCTSKSVACSRSSTLICPDSGCH